MVVVCAIAATACGGAGGGNIGGNTGGNSGGSSGGSSGGPPTRTPSPYYFDVRGYDVASGAEQVEVGRWPSWRHQFELVPACAPGEASYADRCWQRLVIDVDARAVTFAATGGETARLALGEPEPEVLGSLYVGEPDGCRPSTEEAGPPWTCGWPHPRGAGGYVGMRGPAKVGYAYPEEDLWDLPLHPLPKDRPLTRTPWAIGSQIDFDEGVVGGFLVKTQLLYGFRLTTAPPFLPEYEIVHSGSYAGELVVNGTRYPLPVRLATIAAATGASIQRFILGEDEFVDLGGSTVRITADAKLAQARSKWHAAPAGVEDGGLVTSVEFHSRPVTIH